MRACVDCAMPYVPAARNQKRCTACRVLRDVEYWAERGEFGCASCGELHVALASGDSYCAACDPSAGVLLAGTAVQLGDFKDSDPRVRASALRDARAAQDNRRQYAKMPPDPVVPARGSSDYEVLAGRVWERLGDSAPNALTYARMKLEDLVGPGYPLPQYLVMAAALGAV